MKEFVELTNELNGIVEVRYGNEIYKTWTVKIIAPLITKFLKGIYPDSLVVRGLTDIVVFDNKSDDIIPVEIQKSPISNKKFSNSTFEDRIRRQLEDNIENYGKCWFFFDSEYLRYLQSGNVEKTTSVNLTWIIKLVRENRLKIFTIKHNGVVRELTIKDFDFLKDISQTCPLGCDSDERVLEKNKLKIKRNVLCGHNFTQEEINKFESEFDGRVNKEETRHVGIMTYCMNNNNKRCKLYGDISHSINCLLNINNVLSCTSNGDSYIYLGVILDIFHKNEFYGHNNNARIQFVDKFDIAQYFPGYLRNKEMWDYCKNKQRIFTIPEFNGIIDGTFNYEFIKKQSTIADYD